MLRPQLKSVCLIATDLHLKLYGFVLTRAASFYYYYYFIVPLCPGYFFQLMDSWFDQWKCQIIVEMPNIKRWCLEMPCFVSSEVQNPNILSSLSYMKRKVAIPFKNTFEKLQNVKHFFNLSNRVILYTHLSGVNLISTCSIVIKVRCRWVWVLCKLNPFVKEA